METGELVLVAIATLTGATVQSATGFGYALVAAPALFAVAEPEEAVTTMLVLSTVLNLLMLLGERRSLELRPKSGRILGWAAPGAVAGVFVLVALTKPTLQVLVGVRVIVAVAIQAGSARKRAVAVSPGFEAAAGLTAGVLTTTTATSGPPLVLLLRSEGASPGQFRDTMAALLFCLNLIGALALVVAGGRLELPSAWILAVLIAAIAFGRFAGRLIFDRLNPDSFRRAGTIVIFAAGLASIAAGLA